MENYQDYCDMHWKATSVIILQEWKITRRFGVMHWKTTATLLYACSSAAILLVYDLEFYIKF